MTLAIEWPGRVRFPWRRWNPLRRTFRLLTSVRFALALIGALATASLIGVLLPQMPPFVAESDLERQRWLAEQSGRFGPFTVWMERAQLFEVFRSAWFSAGLAVLVISIAVCTVNRLPSTWRSIVRPQRRVADRYLARAHHRAAFTLPGEAAELLRQLRRRRYHVSTEERDGALYLYADRFPWARLGTFATHLALVLFIASGLVTWRMAYNQDLLIGEGASRPVKDPGSADHMVVQSLGFERAVDGDGNVLDFVTKLAVFRDGKEVARGATSMNDPFEFDGYRFYQVAFATDGVALSVRDDETDNVVYQDVLQLAGRLPAPRIEVEDADGTMLFDDFLAPTVFTGERVSQALLQLPGDGEAFWIATRMEEAADAANGPPFSTGVLAEDGTFQRLGFGDETTIGERTFRFASLGASNYFTLEEFPGTSRAMVETLERADGTLEMTIVRSDAPPIRLEPGEQISTGGLTYSFDGRRDFSGLTVRKDPGTPLIWIAAALLLGGLGLTFYLPRRRIWGKVEGQAVQLAGVAERNPDFDAELRRIGTDAGSPDAASPVPGEPHEEKED